MQFKIVTPAMNCDMHLDGGKVFYDHQTNSTRVCNQGQWITFTPPAYQNTILIETYRIPDYSLGCLIMAVGLLMCALGRVASKWG